MLTSVTGNKYWSIGMNPESRPTMTHFHVDDPTETGDIYAEVHIIGRLGQVAGIMQTMLEGSVRPQAEQLDQQTFETYNIIRAAALESLKHDT
jgi:hypothetical protein